MMSVIRNIYMASREAFVTDAKNISSPVILRSIISFPNQREGRIISRIFNFFVARVINSKALRRKKSYWYYSQIKDG